MDKAFYRIHFLSIVVLLSSVSVLAGQERAKVIYDNDFGQLRDGVLALDMLVQSDSVEVLGVTTVVGDSWVEASTAYALRFLEVLNRTDIPVYQGAGVPLMGDRKAWLGAYQKLWGKPGFLGAWNLGKRPTSYRDLKHHLPYGGNPTTKPQDKSAAEFIVEAVKKYPNKITIFCVGPTTNLALAIRTNPEIIPLIKEVVYMGGGFQGRSSMAEFNFWFDPEAAKITIRTPFKKQTLVPWDATTKPEVKFSHEHYERIVSGPDTPLVQMIRDIYGPLFATDENSKVPRYTRFMWDAIATSVFLKPDLINHVEEQYVDVEVLLGLNYGRSVGFEKDRFTYDYSTPGSLDNFPAGTQKISVVYDIDGEAFWDLFVELMTKPY